jgi:uncharacterized protein (DUF3820 family)
MSMAACFDCQAKSEDCAHGQMLNSQSCIDAQARYKAEQINTHNLKVDFGKHAGMLYTRLPVSYLKWMVQCNHSKKDIAAAELKRRGTVTPELDISGHAIDRASLRCRKIWHETALSPEEGLHAWLVRMCTEAIEKFPNYLAAYDNIIYYNGLKLVFEKGTWPVLKTVMPL